MKSINGKSVKKTVAVTVIGVMLSGVLAVSALATPDEWIQEKTPYLGGSAPAVRPAGGGSAGQYVVGRGDTVLSISGRLGVPVAELAEMNSLRDLDLIREGQVLLVPCGIQVHRVSAGETLSAIARKFGVPAKEIALANGLKNEDLVIEGQKLLIARNTGSPGSLTTSAASRGLPVGDLDWPVVGWISSPFGMREGRLHEGVDIAADHGTQIRAAMAGRVTFAGPRGGYGLTVIIDHGDGLCTLYAHSSKLLVREGEWVSKGEVIALVGNTGNSRGPHLHLELQLNGTPYDPLLCFTRIYA